MPATSNPEVLDLGNHLLGIVREQQTAIANEDVDRFEQLVSQREASQAALLAAATAVAADVDCSRAMRQLVEQIAAIDRATLTAAKVLLDDMAGELQQMKRGRTALHGYGQIGNAAPHSTVEHRG